MNKILVVEDERDVRLNIKELLEAEDFEVELAEDGNEGFKQANECNPDLIVCDIFMPGMDGIELLKLLQKDKNTASIPFIFLTAKAEMNDLREGMSLGADDYLTKPFRANDLLNAINARLTKKENYTAIVDELRNTLIRKFPHELRTPLVGILGFSEIAQNNIDTLTPDEISKVISGIYKSGKRLHRRIEKFIKYAELLSIDKNEIVRGKKQFRLESYIINSYALVYSKEFKREKDIKIKVEDASVQIVEAYFLLILKELIENALRYSEKGTEILIEGAKHGKFYNLSIKDNGRGMPKNSIFQIGVFSKFGENKDSEEGIGLGLAIVKKVLELFNGYIEIKSEENKNTEIKISIPLLETEK